MTPRSKKAKGRRFQQEIAKLLLGLCPNGGFSSTPMGVPGTDVADPFRLLPWRYIECRNREGFPTLDAIIDEMQKERSGDWAYVIRRNRQAPTWVLSHVVMQKLLAAWVQHNGDQNQSARNSRARAD